MTHYEKCPLCGRFCGIVYRYRGANYMEVSSCNYCGRNVPKCNKETGTVYGCSRNATKEVPDVTHRRYWCDEHAPDGAVPLPYTND